MSDRGDESDSPLWADGDMLFRVAGAGDQPDRLVPVRRPFAVLGRTADANLPLDDRAVSARHAYLHLDRRGVYVIDLITRTGTRINGTGEMVGWLRPGDWIEVAGRRIELVRIRLAGVEIDPPPCNADMLADNGLDLRLMPSVNSVNGIPTGGKNLVIVATIQGVLHFRILDADGKRVADTDEKQLPDKAPQIARLKSLLGDLWGVPELSQSDKDWVIRAVTSIVGHTPDNGQGALYSLTLEPRRANDSPWELKSELVFLGWSASCGIQVKDTAVARTHCALVRSPTGAYLVDLCGRQTWVEDRPVRGAVALRDGDLITIGSTYFTARVGPPPRPAAQLPQVIPRREAATLLARVEAPETGHALSPFPAHPLPINPELVPAEAQTALLAWMMGTIQGGQGEVLRRQGEFQLAMTEALRQIQQDSATLLNVQLQRIESIDRELAALRAELERRHARPAPPDVAPLRVPRPTPPPDGAQTATKASTTWLLQRVNQLEDENRSAWKDLIGRLSQPRRAT
jgi:pSer/pThr/pTyr-binding forkhead associated (FHA) protein